MSDIILHRSRDHVLVVAGTEVGKKWMENNMKLDHPHTTTIQGDTLEDFIKALEDDDISYEH